MPYLKIQNIDGTQWGRILEFDTDVSFPLDAESSIFVARVIAKSGEFDPFKVSYDLLINLEDGESLTAQELEFCLGYHETFELKWYPANNKISCQERRCN